MSGGIQVKENKKQGAVSLPILPIGSIAAAVNVNQRTLRIYDKEGILTPKRTDKNRRYYTLEDLEKAKVILFLTRNLLLNLAGVKMILAVLEKENIKTEDYLDYVKNIASRANITNKVQQSNLTKTSKRGRPSVKS